MANAIVKGITGQVLQNTVPVQPTCLTIDHSITDNSYITWKSPNELGYIETVPKKGRINIHLDKYNYLVIQDDATEGNNLYVVTRTKGTKNLI